MKPFHNITSRLISLSLLVTLETISCASLQQAQAGEPLLAKNNNQSAVKEAPLTNAPPATPKAEEPEKVQLTFQEEFARQLAKAGPKAEGWALFSDSPMTHNGQRWIIKSRLGKKDVYKFCLISPGRNACAESDLSRARFLKIEPALKAADQLNHLIPVSFDALTYEYLHAISGNPQTKRVVFKTGMSPFPAEYQNIIKAFNVETPKQK